MGSGVLFTVSSYYHNFYPSEPSYLPKDYPDLTDKVALITGANTGIGYEAAKLLVSKNCFVLMGVRDVSKGNKAIEKLKQELGDSIGKIEIVQVDLSDLTTISEAVEQIKNKTDKLNLIIHNAGVMNPPVGSKSKQGYELQLATNVIGPFLLQKKLDPLFLGCQTDFKRVVWLTSSSHLRSPKNGGIQSEDINFIKNPELGAPIYGQSKAANVYLSDYWSKMHLEDVKAQNIVSIAVHPGLLDTSLFANPTLVQRIFLKKFFRPPVFGAYTELFCALSPTLSCKDNGKYAIPWGNIGQLRDDIEQGKTNGIAKRLWEWLNSETKEY